MTNEKEISEGLRIAEEILLEARVRRGYSRAVTIKELARINKALNAVRNASKGIGET